MIHAIWLREFWYRFPNAPFPARRSGELSVNIVRRLWRARATGNKDIELAKRCLGQAPVF